MFPVHLQWDPSFLPWKQQVQMQCGVAGWAVTHLAILGVDVLVVPFDDCAVNEEAPHHHDHF